MVQLLGFYTAFLYAVIYCAYNLRLDEPMNDSGFKVTFTTLPGIYQKAYHESLGISGLHYIALGVGIMMTA